MSVCVCLRSRACSCHPARLQWRCHPSLTPCRSYEGEEGIDAGGVFKDWLGNISRWSPSEQRLNTNL